MTSETEPTRSAATAEFGRTEPQRLPSPMFDDGATPRLRSGDPYLVPPGINSPKKRGKLIIVIIVSRHGR
jgi:hypothetical protein